MNRKTITLLAVVVASWLTIPAAYSQAFAGSGTTTVSVTVGAEASISIDTGATSLTSSGTLFSNFAGTTSFTYKIRTTKVGGTGSITSQVTTDFSPSGGPSVASPPSSGDALTYTCTVSSPGAACSSSQTSSTTASTPVATFGASASSSKPGNSGSVGWTLTNDPMYQTGPYSATVTFTISAT